MSLKETISEQVMLKTKERFGCINLKLIHFGKVINDNVVISQPFSKFMSIRYFYWASNHQQ